MTETQRSGRNITVPDIPYEFPRRWWALAVIALSQLMIALDTTIVTIALPSAQKALEISDVNRQWVITGYTLTFGGLLLLGGRIADRYGRKVTLLAGVLGFAVASMVGGLATNGGMLIGARLGQGVFAALLAPSTLALLNTIFTNSAERAKAIGVYTAVLIAGGALGLVGGGFITGSLSWRWCMFVNVPIALLAAVGAITALPNPPGRPDATVDILSAITGCGGIAGLVYGFTEAGEKGWGGQRVAISLVLAAVLIVAFVILQARQRNALLPLRIVVNRNRGMAFATVALASLGLFAVFLFLTYQLQIVMGYSPLRTGVALLPLVFMNIFAAVLGGKLAPKLPPRVLIVAALFFAVCALLLLTRVTPDSSYGGLLLPVELLIGLGIGTAFGPAVSVATGGVDERDAGVASATVNTAQQVGASIGTALLNTIAASAATAYLTTHAADPRAVLFASTHGYGRAALWAAGILIGTAVLVAVFINAGPQGAATAPPAGEPVSPESAESMVDEVAKA